MLLIAYHWPGNIRELNNIIERLALVLVQTSFDNLSQTVKKVINVSEIDDDYITLRAYVKNGLKDVEKSIINSMLLKYNQDKEQVIEKLRIGRATFWRKI